MKRILLFVMTNLAVVVVLGIIANVLGLNRFIDAQGLNLTSLLGFALIMGFGGAFISLLISKPVAKWSSGVRVINEPQNADEAWIVDTVKKFADKAQIGMPEVGIFEGAPNAFATGAFKNSALVAVSTGLLQGMTREEIEAVIGHEVAHISNGDMVTMTLIQGVLNTSRAICAVVITSWTPWQPAVFGRTGTPKVCSSCQKALPDSAFDAPCRRRDAVSIAGRARRTASSSTCGDG